MADEINLDSYLSSPFSTDVRKQQQAEQAFLSAQNIRKANESVEDYKIRMAQNNEQFRQKILQENTDILQERLTNLNIKAVSNQNMRAIEDFIKNAQSIKFFAHNNHYDGNSIDLTNLERAMAEAQTRLKNMKNGRENKGSGIFSDNYQRGDKTDSLLEKLTGGSSNSTSGSTQNLTMKNRTFFK